MPYLYAHALHGLTAREQFPKAAYEITATHLDAFILGLYGPDVYFGDRLPPPLFAKHRKALGNGLHHTPARVLFGKLFSLAGPDDRAFSFALGMLCHLSLDNTMHPYVESQYRGNDHTRFEMRQDMIIRERSNHPMMALSPTELFCCDRAVRMADGLMTSLIFDLFSEKSCGVYARSYRKWQRVQALVFDPTGRKRKALEKLEKLLGKRKGKFSGLVLSRDVKDDQDRLFNLDHAPWQAPWAPEEERQETYFELFDRAVADAAKLVTAAMSEREYGIYDEVLALVGGRTMDGVHSA